MMNPQPVLFTNRLGRLSGSKRSRSGGHVTRMGKSEMQKICFWLDSHGNKDREKTDEIPEWILEKQGAECIKIIHDCPSPCWYNHTALLWQYGLMFRMIVQL